MLSRPLASSSWLLISLFVLSACGTSVRTPPLEGVPSDDGAASLSASSSAVASSRAKAMATATASAENVASTSSALPSAAPSGSAKAVPLPRVPTSPGKVWCGAAECDVSSETCCSSSYLEGGRCVPKAKGCSDSEYLWVGCDESADCGKQLCCYAPRPDPTVPAYMECRDRCEDPALETCLAGGKCRSGKACKLTEPSAPSGYCP